MDNNNFPMPTTLRVDASWRARVQNPVSDQAMTDTRPGYSAHNPTHNSIALLTSTSAFAGRVAVEAAKQAAPPRGIPKSHC